MATTQTTKRRTAQTKRSTTAKKAAGTRARKTARTQASRAKTSAKAGARRTTRRPENTGVVAQAQLVGAKVGNAVQTGITAGSKATANVAKRIAKAL